MFSVHDNLTDQTGVIRDKHADRPLHGGFSSLARYHAIQPLNGSICAGLSEILISEW
jgi:hypothetical protein